MKQKAVLYVSPLSLVQRHLSTYLVIGYIFVWVRFTPNHAQGAPGRGSEELLSLSSVFGICDVLIYYSSVLIVGYSCNEGKIWR